MTTASKERFLTDGQIRFAGLLERAPFLAPCRDWERAECSVDALNAAMGAMSHGEQIMAKFMAGLRLGSDEFEFDIFEAAATLDAEKRAVIAQWLNDPFWP